MLHLLLLYIHILLHWLHLVTYCLQPIYISAYTFIWPPVYKLFIHHNTYLSITIYIFICIPVYQLFSLYTTLLHSEFTFQHFTTHLSTSI